MKRIKKSKIIISFLLVAVIMIGMIVPAVAAPFSIRTIQGQLIADENTQYVAYIEQNPTTKLIKVSFKITNGNASEPLVISNFGSVLEFSSAVAPFAYDPNDPGRIAQFWSYLYSGGVSDDLSVINKYVNTPIIGFDYVGAAAIQNNAQGRFIGGKVSNMDPKETISLAPKATTTIIEYYFMPVNGTDILNMDMFNFKTINTVGFIMLNTYIGNGSRFLVADPTHFAVMKEIQPSAFKIEITQSAPTNLSAHDPNDGSARWVDNYNSSTMEWSYTAAGPYRSDVDPIILDEGCDIYVRMKGTVGYTGSDPMYGAYKKLLVSDSVKLEFGGNEPPCEALCSVTKTATNITNNPDGYNHVGDVIEYKVVARNSGHTRSNWASAVMTDTIPAGLTLDTGYVYVDSVKQSLGVGFTFSGGVLNVPCGIITGQTEREIIFRVTVDASAAGQTITNTARVTGTDKIGGTSFYKEASHTGGITIRGVSAAPTIDDITVGDRTITGTGVNGAKIVVTLPNNVVLPEVTVSGGVWSVTFAPPIADLISGNVVKAVQTEPSLDASAEVQKTVGQRPNHIEFRSKTSTSTPVWSDGARRVGDTINYTITVRNDGPAKSLWEFIYINDMLPDGVNYIDNSLLIDGAASAAGVTMSYAPATRIITVSIDAVPGGVTREVTFSVTIDESARGKKINNVATINGVDTKEPDYPEVPERSKQPTVDVINEGDRVITGKGEPGSKIEVTFPNSITKGTGTVDTNGDWTVDVPKNVQLVQGDVVSVTQTELDSDPCEPVDVTVLGKADVVPYVTKEFENQTSTDGKTRVGDVIKYTVTVGNSGSPKSYWTSAVMTDVLPANVELDYSSIMLDGVQPTYSSYNSKTGTLQVTIWKNTGNYIGIKGGTASEITFEVTVKSGSQGVTVQNSVNVNGFGNGDPNIPITGGGDDGGGFDVLDKSDKPIVNDVSEDDNKITGTGTPGAQIVVTLDDGTKLPPVVVDTNGDWEAPLGGNVLVKGDVITVVQTETGKDVSDPETTIVKDSSFRKVKGYVWPIITRDLGIPGFLDQHAITVELRPTYLTPAASGLSVKAEMISSTSTVGEFTFDHVPFGDYILVVKRPGYLVRAMAVTISAAADDDNDGIIILQPPQNNVDQVYNGQRVFDLWWGDCNGDFRVDNDDAAMILELMSIGVSATHKYYNPACDMNADGRPDNDDINLVLEYWDRYASQYAGAENINFKI